MRGENFEIPNADPVVSALNIRPGGGAASTLPINAPVGVHTDLIISGSTYSNYRQSIEMLNKYWLMLVV